MQKLDTEIGSKLKDWYRYVESSHAGDSAAQSSQPAIAKPQSGGRRRFRFSDGAPELLLTDASIPAAPAKETREELLARLLDPVLSLEETAQVLDVCPTTVRRYTNRGLLEHHRTAGNQRRFRLSHVLAFLARMSDTSGAGTISSEKASLLAEFSASRGISASGGANAMKRSS